MTRALAHRKRYCRTKQEKSTALEACKDLKAIRKNAIDSYSNKITDPAEAALFVKQKNEELARNSVARKIKE